VIAVVVRCSLRRAGAWKKSKMSVFVTILSRSRRER
jgi:hypothetical protein